MLAAVMVVEGVLRHPDSEGHFDTGWCLFQALVKNSRLHLLSHQWTESDISHWLARRHLIGYQSYLHAPEPGAAGRLETLHRVRGWRIGSLYIDADAACTAAARAAGWNVALLSHGQQSPMPQPLRPWDDLTDAVEHQHSLRLTTHQEQQ
ncbi:hypothetical protein ACF06W_11785 [Streptomyces albus]|uniref:hypothetical protein n=1 Tax=Streptomyces albus TaxID=1888 RepID=UPI0037004F31